MVRIVRQGKDIARYKDLWENQMRNISLVAAIALMLAGKISLIAAIALLLAGAISTTQARIDVPAGAQIDPLHITMVAASSTDSRLSRTWAIKSLVIWQPHGLRWGMQDRARPGQHALSRPDASSAEPRQRRLAG
jgi:hypothetical protein